MLNRLGLAGLAGTGLAIPGLRADETPIGDPFYKGFSQMISPLPHTMQDVPSAYLENGEVVQPRRTIPIFSQVDVVVVGGGPAGFAAAVAAARAGAKTALVERYGSLGGLFTNGMVLLLLSIGVKEDGKYRQVVQGVCGEFMERLKKMPNGISNRPNYVSKGLWQPDVDPEAAKVLMDEMIAEAKVEMCFHAWGVDVIQQGNAVKGVVFESKQGRQAILAKQVVDASGDGDVYFQAGADYRQITHGIGFIRRFGNIDRLKAQKDGKTQFRSGDQPVASATWGGSPMGPKEQKGNGLDIRVLSAREVEHRRRIWQSFVRLHGKPGNEELFLMDTCSQLGVRATRLLAAEKMIDREGALSGRRFDDVVGICGDDAFCRPEFQIPLGSLIPKDVDNVVACGRCLGCTPDLIDRIRLIGPCFVSGHAAGVAAAVAALRGTSVRDVPVGEVQRVLRAQGANLG